MTFVMRALAVVCLVLALVSCSSDDDEAGSTTTTSTTVPTTTTMPAATPDELAAAVCAARPVPGRLRLSDPEINELSGLVALDSGWWAHNDSGDVARIFRLG